MPRRSGFTIVELLVYIGITSIALVVFTGFMVNTVASTSRARQIQSLQQNARFVLDRLSQTVRNASSLSTTVTTITAGTTTFAYDSGNKKFTMDGDDLTSPTVVTVDSFSVLPVPAPVPSPQLITVSFTISTKNATPAQSLPVTTTLIPHNQLYK